ncbi:MAG: hypothetical protein ACYS8L_04515 [Planctomycetota bacterium]
MTRSRRAITALVFLLLMAIAVPSRLLLLREPLNSDDYQYRAAGAALLRGTHRLQTGLKPTTEGGRVNHHWMRLGLVLPVALAIRVFSDHFVAYYIIPFSVSLLAIALVFFILQRLAGNVVAFFAGLVQVFNPLEVYRSSVLLTNLPVATLIVGFVLMLYAVPEDRRSWGRDIAVGCVMGVLLSWAYLLRISAPVALAPCFAACLLLKRYRRVVLISLAVLLVVSTGELLLHMSRGGEFAYRRHNVAIAIERYKGILPHTRSLSKYLLRYPHLIGNMTDSKLVVSFFYLSIACHIYLIVVARDVPIRLLAACGLLNLCVYAFSVFGPLSEGFLTMPAKTRFIQLFLLTSVISVARTLSQISRLWLQPFYARLTEGRLKAAIPWAVVAVGFLFFFVPCVMGTRNLPESRLLSMRGTYLPILLEIDALMDRNGLQSVEVVGTTRGVSAISMFTWLHPDRRIDWRPHPIRECIRVIEEGSAPVFLTDFHREKTTARYIKGESTKAKRAALVEQLERVVTERMHVLRSRRDFVLARSRELK